MLATLRDAALPLVIVLVLSVFRGGLDAGSLLNGAIFGAIGVAGATVMGWWRWDNTRWWVDDSGIHKRSGLISTTKQTDIPWSRIQALDLQQGDRAAVVQRARRARADRRRRRGGRDRARGDLGRGARRACARWSPCAAGGSGASRPKGGA